MNDKHKLIPKRRFKEFENADAWEQRKLGALVQFVNGRAYKQEELLDVGKYKVVRVGNFNTNEKWYFSDLELETDKYMDNGDLLYLWATSFGPVIWQGEKAIFHYHIWKLKNFESLDKKYLYSFLEWDKHKISQNTNGSTMVHITKNMIEQRDIEYPTKSEQYRIGSLLESVDNLITLHQRKLHKLEEIKSAYLAEMFPIQGEFKPKRRFSDFKEDWNWSTLKDIGNTFTGLSGKTKEDFGHGEAKFITYMNVYSNPISDLNGLENIEIDKKQFEVKYGDVLFTTSSETPEEVGMSSVWLGNEEDVYLNSFCFGFRPSVDIDKYYLAFMLRSVSIRKKFQLLAQGISRYNISKNKVMEMSIPLPCIDEQKKIGLLFKNIEQTIHSQKETVEKLINLKNAYLNEMFV